MAPIPRPKSLREHALDAIRTAISTGELAEDTVYSAAALAKHLGISLSPVREAMMSLVAEGTVEAIPNRGFRLVPVSTADLEEIIALRCLLARPAAANLATGSDDAAVDRLAGFAAATLAAAEAGDKAEFYAADRAFHAELLAAGLGQRAADISLRLRDQSRIGEDGEKSQAIDIATAGELVELVSLIRAGRSAEAADLVEQNLYYFRRSED